MKDLEEKIKKFLNSEEKKLILKDWDGGVEVSASTLFETFEKAGGKLQGNFESNGWEWYYWEDGIFKDKLYELSGSGWWGHAAIEIKED